MDSTHSNLASESSRLENLHLDDLDKTCRVEGIEVIMRIAVIKMLVKKIAANKGYIFRFYL